MTAASQSTIRAWARPTRGIAAPSRLVWSAEFARVEDAYAFEKRVQGWGRRKREALIAGEYDSLPLLASRSAEARRRWQ